MAENLLSRIVVGPARRDFRQRRAEQALPRTAPPGSSPRAIGPEGRSRSRSRSLIPTSTSFPSSSPTVRFLPDKSYQGPDVGKSHLFTAQVGALRDWRPYLRLAGRPQGDPPQGPRRGGDDQRRTRQGRVGSQGRRHRRPQPLAITPRRRGSSRFPIDPTQPFNIWRSPELDDPTQLE